MTKIFNIMVTLVLLGMLWITKASAQVTKDNLDQNADQAQGNYATTNLNYLGSGSLGMMQSAWKDPLQHMGEGQTKPGYTKYYWTPELVLPVRLREGMYTLINFPEWEVIENVYLGDAQSFNAEIQGPSSLMVYPEASQFVGVDTNMIVFGRSGNKYVFYVQSETVNTDRITNAIIDIEVVKKQGATWATGGINNGSGSSGFLNNEGQGSNGTGVDSTYTRNLQREDWIEKIPVDPTKFRFDIEVYVPNPDDIIIAPERVWRDNIFTYIDLGEKALTAIQRPIVTMIVERSETPVGFRAAGPNNRLIVVEGMGDMVLRSGKRIVCLKLRRADSDGLENTVYAKTNEWDLQNSYASQPQNSAAVSDSVFPYEDVYNDNLKPQNENKDSSFFNNLFSSGGTATLEERNNNQNTHQINTTNSALSNIDALPKVEPIMIENSAKSAPTVTGQVDVKTGLAEVAVPEYNNQPIAVKATQGIPESQKVETKTGRENVGKSNNNSNPVVITPKEDLSKNNSLISSETEALLQEFRRNKSPSNSIDTNITIELGEDENVNNLEKLWQGISKQYSATLGKYQPFYSVDAPADGRGKDIFHLRIGPVKSLSEGDKVCTQLTLNGIICRVIRTE